MVINNKELLFGLLKAKDKNEIRVIVNGGGAVFLNERGSAQSIFLFQIQEVGYDLDEKEEEKYYEETYNEPFRESFYKEKGLDKCWVKDCQNKIYQKEGDYKKMRLQCLEEKHTRMVCVECSRTDYVRQLMK